MKIISLILIAVLLTGCNTTQVPIETTHPSEVTPSPTPEVITYNDQQLALIDNLIYENGYFEDVIKKRDELTYTIDGNKIIIKVRSDYTIDLDIDILTNKINYNLIFPSVSHEYKKDEKIKTAILNTTFDSNDNPRRNALKSTLTTSDNQEFNIMFDTTKVILNNGTPDLPTGQIQFVDELHEKLTSTYIDQHNLIAYLNEYLSTLSPQFYKINSFPNSFEPESPFLSYIDGYISKYEKTNLLNATYMKDYYYVSINNGESIRYTELEPKYKTAALFFFINSENPSTLSLAESFINTSPQYVCMGALCNTIDVGSGKSIDISHGRGDSGYKIALSLSNFNIYLKDVFDYKKEFIIKDNELLNNGIVLNKNENVIVADSLSGDGPVSKYGLVYEEIKSEGDTITVRITPYYAKCTSIEGDIAYYKFMNNKTREILSDEIEEKSLYDYVLKHKSNFTTWEITMKPGSNAEYYQIISFNKK